MERCKKSAVVNMAFCRHDRHPHDLSTLRKGSVVEMDEPQLIAAATCIAMLSKNHEHIVVFEEDVCDVGAATAHGEAGIQDKPV